MNILLRTLLVGMASACVPAHGQNVEQLPKFDVQSLVYSNNGIVNGCGARMIGVTSDAKKTVDVSVNIARRDKDFISSVKLISYDMVLSKSGVPQPTSVRVKSGWIKLQIGQAMPPTGPAIVGDDGKSQLYPVSSSIAIDVLMGILKQQELLVGIARAPSANERIYNGPIQITPRDAKVLADCMGDLSQK